MFLFAGHGMFVSYYIVLADQWHFLVETSSHTLAFALTLVAFFPEVQRKIYEETKSIWPNESPGASSVRGYSLILIHIFSHFSFGCRCTKLTSTNWFVPPTLTLIPKIESLR
jgi:hypothetical protein